MLSEGNMKLATESLVLRTVEVSDIEEVARMWAFEKGSISKEEAQGAIDYMQNNHKKNDLGHIYHLCLAVLEKDKTSIIGWCGLDGKTADKLHIFLLIDKDYRNKGYATQCAKRLLSYAFNEAYVPFVNGGCDKDNIASYTVMVKSGMRKIGLEENGDPILYIDEDMYRNNSV
jgi:RimJ/RimL family protein N-acetyltransferase